MASPLVKVARLGSVLPSLGCHLNPGAVMILRSYGAALRDLGLADRHVTGGRSNNRADFSHQPAHRRERQQLRFRSPGSAQRFLASHAAVANHFNVQRHLISRRPLKTLRGLGRLASDRGGLKPTAEGAAGHRELP